MKRNGYQEFEEREDLKREKELNENLSEKIRLYKSSSFEDIDKEIQCTEEIIEAFKELKREGFEYDLEDLRKFEKRLDYLQFTKRYEQTNEITRVKIKDVIEESKRIEEEHEKRMAEYRKKGEEEER